MAASALEMTRDEVDRQLATLLRDVCPNRAIVVSGGEDSFVIGPESVCGKVLGLYDSEYGWPAPIAIADVDSVAQLQPGPRSHPFVVDGTRVLAVAVTVAEYQAILLRQRLQRKVP